MTFIYLTSTNLVDFSPNQHSGNQNKHNIIILVALHQNWTRYSQNILEQSNKMKLHVPDIKLNLSKVIN